MSQAETQRNTFQRAVSVTLKECQEIIQQRGTEYLDSWAIENLRMPFLDHTLAALKGHEGTPEGKRLIATATLCDIKLARLLGPWKRDTVVDLINYAAAYAALRDVYDSDHRLLVKLGLEPKHAH